jgi:hypothetical protein
MTKTFEKECAAVDDFLSRDKFLVGSPPQWRVSSRQADYEAIWNIQNDLGIEVGQLRFRCPRASAQWPSASLLFQGNPVYRVDLVDGKECKFNPYDAGAYGLQPRVCGPHEHNWKDNRYHVLMNGFDGLPYRRSIQPQIRRVEQILPWLADQIRLKLDPAQRLFDGPPQRELFGQGG